MAGGGGSTGGIGAQSPASGGFGGGMGGGYGNNSQLGQLGNMANAAGVPNDLSLMQGGPHVGGGFGGSMGGEYSPNPMGGLERPQVGYDGGSTLSNMGNNTRLGNNMGQQQTMPYQPAIGMPGGQGGQTTYGNIARPPAQSYDQYLASRSPVQQNVQLTQDQWQQNQNRMQHIPQQQMQGGIEQDQDFRNFRSQHDDLSRQMNEYMQKAPMYQQLQELQGKMQGVQSRYAPQQQMQRPQQRGRYPNFNPMQQQLGGLAALLGGLGRR